VRRLISSQGNIPNGGSTVRLTPREHDVLRLVALGKANKEIAVALSISERTARTHVSNILAKLGLKSRTQAAIWAARKGLADVGSD
jgi:DNA-binding NarL/FixJ family response regulator